jgi:hypothetical protein
VNITVTGGGCADPQYVENNGYVAGSRVKNAGNSYECKPHPFSGWCNGAAWAYAPGTGAYWQDAWIPKGTCGSARSRTDSPEAENEVFSESDIINADADGLGMYPNPGKRSESQNVTLTFEKTPDHVRVNLQDINGVEAYNNQYSNLKTNTVNVKMPSLPQGLYIMRVQTENNFWIRKYLIKD